MIILSHRGFWLDRSERNTAAAFQRSFDSGFGTETDLRDICGRIVISHDMPHGGEMTFRDMMDIMAGRNLPLALNIKADGMAGAILEILAEYGHTNYFTFDMSIPDMVVQTAEGLNVFTGLSDLVPTPILADKCGGIWLDSFNSDWFDVAALCRIAEKYGRVCIVSADLHGRDTVAQWAIIRDALPTCGEKLMLCTDTPEKAKEYFND